MAGASDIRVFVKWHERTVFAGEEVRCTITFRNVASVPAHMPHQRTPRQSPAGLGLSPGSAGVRMTSKLQPQPTTPRGHRSTMSMSSPRVSAPQPLQAAVMGGDGRERRGHRKSVSIVSIGSGTVGEDFGESHAGRLSRFNRGHGRASSLQIASFPPELGATQSAVQSPRNTTSPLFSPGSRQHRPSRASTLPNTPNTPTAFNPRTSPRRPARDMPDFRFPAEPASPKADMDSHVVESPIDEAASPRATPSEPVDLPVRSKIPPVPEINEGSTADRQAPPTNRILAPASLGTGTPRSSGEFYSLSNNSDETLASEYVAQPAPRASARPSHLRLLSTSSVKQARQPESLMMGYAQIQGSFTLDGSLADLAPFEQVKKKAVVGGQGGGVIGVETTKRDSGLLGSFGWGSISNSLGELLGGGELSSIREMRGIANSKAIPLLSTPQSILFVDMKLAPGESRSFEYVFKLPRGLPPSHRGKAAKITYSLVIGTQRAGGIKEQRVRSVEIPFRVIGSVNSHGELLGHDLMQPYIILQDQAKVKALPPAETANGTSEDAKAGGKAKKDTGSNVDDFLTYVDELLKRPRSNTTGLLSPTAGPSRQPSLLEEDAPPSVKEAIDMAILRSNVAPEGQGSPNRFEISRNGRRVAVVVLTRPAYRLGETITGVVDFVGAEVSCYAVHYALETSEKIDSSLAIRSEASVGRVTRRVIASGSEGSMFARRVVFNTAIPLSATPEFFTSGVGLEWKIRLEFVVPFEDQKGDEDEDERWRGHPLLEELGRDEKGGMVLVGAEGVDCESFEVVVPIRVYGAAVSGEEESEEGLAV